jgi:predicted ATPase/DNA-binding CsgD family transcriptional regulator
MVAPTGHPAPSGVTFLRPADAEREQHAPQGRLPVPLTPLIGREEVVAAIARLLDRARLLTLTGPGGIGKTRLAIEAAEMVREMFPAGVCFVPLAAISDAELVGSAIAKALGMREAANQTLVESLVMHLDDKKILLLLDNFEQVSAAAPHVTELLMRCSALVVLVTSRSPLHVYGEREYPVPPLAVPERARTPGEGMLRESAAARLFVERMQAVRPNFVMTDAHAALVAEICRQLDGLPLAIELAAARGKVLSPQTILGRLENRLALLTGGARDLPVRQQTLRNTIDWSYGMLDAGEQRLFARVAVFARGGTLEALEAICAAVDGDATGVLDRLWSLVDKNLVRHMDGADGEPCFSMLTTIRAYALERLAASGEEAAIRRAHAAHYRALAETAEPALMGPGQNEWLTRLDEDYDNLRGALEWAIAGDETETALRTAAALEIFWMVRGYISEGRRWLETALARPADVPAAVRAKALLAAGMFAQYQGEYAHARARFTESRALFERIGDRRGIAHALISQGAVALADADLAAVRAYHEEGLARFRALGDQDGIARALASMAEVAARSDVDFATARALLEESLALRRLLGNKRAVAMTITSLAEVAESQADRVRFRAYAEESLTLWRELGDPRGIAMSLNHLAILATYDEDYAAARSLTEESLALKRQVGDRRGIALALSALAWIARQQGDFATARARSEESLAIRRDVGDRWGIARSLANLGLVALAESDLDAARRFFGEDLEIRRALGDTRGIAECLYGFAGLAWRGGDTALAARLWGAEDALRAAIGAPRSAAERAEYDREVSAARAHLDPAAWDAAWSAGSALSLDAAVTAARALAPAAPPPAAPPPHPGLTPRQVEVIRLIATGRSNREIADMLSLSIRTVERHIDILYGKINARSRADATAYAFRHQLIEESG